MAPHTETSDLVATELHKALNALGLPQHHIARWFSVSQRSVRRWRDGSRRTPRGALIVLRLLATQAVTIEEVERAVARTDNNGNPGPPAAPEQSGPARAPAAALADSGLTTAEKVIALAPGACRWPCGDPRDRDFCFCSTPLPRGLIASGTAPWPTWRDRRQKRALDFVAPPLLPHPDLGSSISQKARSNRHIFAFGRSRHHLRHVMFGEAVGDHELHRLALGEGRAEGDALLGVVDGELEAALGDAEPAASLVESPGGDPRLRLPHPL